MVYIIIKNVNMLSKKRIRFLKKCKIRIALPECAFPGKNVDTMKKAVGIAVDPISVIAKMLLDKKIVGKKGEYFLNRAEAGRKVYSNLNTGEAFRKAQEQIGIDHGPGVDGLFVIFAMDKTYLTPDGNVGYNVYIYSVFFIII
jgi:hypothetical protein